jgi:hypothetical protein
MGEQGVVQPRWNESVGESEGVRILLEVGAWRVLECDHTAVWWFKSTGSRR